MVVEAGEALDLSYKIRPNGCYCFVSGPCYESKAECRFLRGIGGDSVGMSTIPEVIAAKHCGMQILGLSLITNKVITGNEETPAASHAEVLAAVEASGMHVEAIVRRIISKSVVGSYLQALPTFVYTPVPSISPHGATGTTGKCPYGAKCPCGPNCTCGPSCSCGASTTADCACGPNCPCGPNCTCGPDCNCSATASNSCCGSKRSRDDCVNTLVSVAALGAIVGGLFYMLKHRNKY
jgi:hypothetical protein